MSIVVPESPPNSYPVVAVVAEGNAVKTSNASFQLTPATESAVTELVETTTTSSSERVQVTTPPEQTPTNAETRGAGVTDGLDPSLADTVDRVPDSTGTGTGSPEAAIAAKATAEAAAAANAGGSGGPRPLRRGP